MQFQIEFNKLINLVLDTFEWKGLPETCDIRFLESSLLWRAFAGFKREKDGTIRNYSAGPGGRLTMYGYPSNGYLYALNGTVAECEFYWPYMDNSNADGVLCLDNKQGYPLIYEVIMGAYRISDARRALDVAIQNSKRPYVFNGTEEQVKTMKSIYNDIVNNEPFLIINKSTLDADKPAVQNLGFKEGTIKELWDAYSNTKADVLQGLGVDMNVNSDKKERMTEAEVEGDTQLVDRYLQHRLTERKEFCKRINEAFGLNVSVDIKHKEEPKEIEDNGQNEDTTTNFNNED